MRNKSLVLANLILILALLLSQSLQYSRAQDILENKSIFLPLVHRAPEPHTISGQVTTLDDIPVSGVQVNTQNGNTTLTDGEGKYVLAGLAEETYTLQPQKEGYTFSPASLDVVVPPDASHINFTSSLVACGEAIINGGFETSTGWELPITEYTAAYSTDRAHSGVRSLRTGITNPLQNKFSYSSGRQPVTIPSDASTASLTFWLYPSSGDPAGVPLPDAPRGLFSPELTSGDVQYVLVLDRFNQIIETLVWQRNNNQVWTFYTFDLLKYKGQTISLHFGTYNDGFNGITSQFVDDVSLNLCPGVATPTATSTATPTLTGTPPIGCDKLMVNESFENDLGWEIPITEFSAGYSTERAHTGVRSMRTGILLASQNKYSYSDARQRITIPAGITRAVLDFWIYASSGESSFTPLPAMIPAGQKFGEAPLAGDVQYVLVLDRYQNILQTLLWQRSNNQTWTHFQYDLLSYKGSTIYIQFGTYNDGRNGVTSMFMDDMQVTACSGIPPTTTTPTPTRTATVTPTPSACTELIVNGGLETDAAWVIPITVFPAGYSTAQAHTGVRSMRTGIISPSQNVYSFSDARQTVTFPSGLLSARLGFWFFALSGESPSAPLPAMPTGRTFGNEPLASDVQYLLVLDQYQNWIDTLFWQRSNSQLWTYLEMDVKKYAGKTVSFQFGTYNDGLSGITAMYFDDVSIKVCVP